MNRRDGTAEKTLGIRSYRRRRGVEFLGAVSLFSKQCPGFDTAFLLATGVGHRALDTRVYRQSVALRFGDWGATEHLPRGSGGKTAEIRRCCSPGVSECFSDFESF